MKKKIVCLLCAFAAMFILIGVMSVAASAEDEEVVTHACSGKKIKIKVAIDGYSLVAQCRRCYNYIYPQQVSIGIGDGTVFCEEDYDIRLNDTGWSEICSQDYIVLYEGDGDTEYEMTATPPTEVGDYIAFITLEDTWGAGADSVANFRTTPVHFSIASHEWKYFASKYVLTAKCANCGESVRAELDFSAVLGAIRSSDSKEICSQLFYSENWSMQDGIDGYAVIYNGVGFDENGKEVKYVNSLSCPEYPGSYTAKLAILTDVNNVKYSVATDEMPFYIAGIPFAQCEVKSYTDEQISAFTKPRTEDNNYYVGTASELLWCVYNQTTDMNIILTDDIILNPILIEDDETITCGSDTIYKWQGFGSESARFEGTIDGMGYTIYGMYMPEARDGDRVAGFICWGKNVTIKNLTISNSYVKATNATGAFVGELKVNGSTSITNCRSLDNLIQSDSEAGGIIGWVGSDRSSIYDAYLVISNCVNDSVVNGGIAGGGIIGKTSPNENDIIGGVLIKNCYNFGKITGSEYAGGIIGFITVLHDLGLKVTNCFNSGYIESDINESGIIAELNTNGNNGALVKGCIDISNNVNVGELYFDCANTGEIIAGVGNSDYYRIGLLKLDNNYYFGEKSAYPSRLEDAPAATRVTRAQIKYGDVCDILGDHIESLEYSDVISPTCEGDGSKNIRCLVCNTILETIEMSAHGHYTSNGVCVHCGESNPATGRVFGASIFSDGSWMVIVVVVVALMSVGAFAFVLNSKKKKTVTE